MKTRVEKYIPFAIKAAKNLIANKDNKIPKEFNGYISSFGAAIILSGLIPAVVFYSEKGGAVSDRQNLMKAIYAIINETEDYNNINSNSLLDFLMEIKDDKKKFDYQKEKIMDAATALKLAVRTFDLVDKENLS